jgi:type I restriction enzyme, S subunit
MNNHHFVPYSVLDSESWTVNSLLMNVKENLGEQICLGDVVEFNRWKLSDTQIDNNTIYKYIEISSIDVEKGLIIEHKEFQGDQLPSRAKLVARKGDILFSVVRPDRRAVAIVPEELDGSLVTNGFAVMSPEKLSGETLYFLLRSKRVRDEFTHLAKGTTIPMVSLKQLKEYELPIESLEMVDENYAKELYAKWRDANKLSEPLQDTIERMFLKNLNPVCDEIGGDHNTKHIILPYKRLEERLDVEYYWPQPSKDIKWNVPVSTLGDVVSEFILGASIVTEDDLTEDSRVLPYINIKDIDDKQVYVSSDNLAFVNSVYKNKLESSKTLGGDIIVVRMGGTLGKCALVQEDLIGSVISQHLVIIRCSNLIKPEYLLYFLKTNWAKEQLANRSTGSVQRFIKIEELKNIKIPVPSIEIQIKIIDNITKVTKNNDLSHLKRELLEFVETEMKG